MSYIIWFLLCTKPKINFYLVRIINPISPGLYENLLAPWRLYFCLNFWLIFGRDWIRIIFTFWCIIFCWWFGTVYIRCLRFFCVFNNIFVEWLESAKTSSVKVVFRDIGWAVFVCYYPILWISNWLVWSSLRSPNVSRE